MDMEDYDVIVVGAGDRVSTAPANWPTAACT